MKNKLKGFFKNFKEKFNPANYIKLYLGIVILAGGIFLAFIILKHTGWLDKLSDVDSLVNIINTKYRVLTILIYILVQMLQVIFLPIPAFVTTTAGFMIFQNMWEPILYSLAGIIPASIIGFMLGRWLGKPFVGWMVGKENMEKYLNKTAGKERPVFFTMFLLPFFPDDILCMVAGITPMSFKFFLIIQFICRPPAVIGTILVNSFFSELKDILFTTWWGIILVILFIFAVGLLLYLSYKYSEKIEKFTIRVIERIKVLFSNIFARIKNIFSKKSHKKSIQKENISKKESFDAKFATSKDIFPPNQEIDEVDKK